MNLFQKLAELANALDAHDLYYEASIADKMLQKLSAPSLVPEWKAPTQAPHPAGMPVPEGAAPIPGIELGDPTVYPSYFAPGGKMLPKYKSLMETLNNIRQELNLGPGTFDFQMAQVLRTKYPQIWRMIKRNPKMPATSILSQIKRQKEFDFAGREIPPEYQARFEVDQKSPGFDFSGQLPEGIELSLKDPSNQIEFVSPGVAGKTEEKIPPIGKPRGGLTGKMQPLPSDAFKKKQETDLQNILNKLSELANKLDTHGLYTEANEIDEMIKTHAASPYDQPNEFVKSWQEHYNQVLTVLQKQFGSFPQGFDLLKQDGIKGPKTTKAIQAVRAYGDLKSFQIAMQQQMTKQQKAQVAQQPQQVPAQSSQNK